MALPASPINGQVSTVNGIAYIYASATGSWTRTSSGINPVLSSSNITVAGNVFAGNVLATGFFYANGTPFTSSSYGNTTVASYLPVYSGSIGAASEIVTLTANAGAQADQITGANAAIVTANTALKNYTDAQITNLTNGAPAILDTLSEIATSLGNNASLSTTLLNSIAGSNAAIITANTALKSYVDTQDSAITTAWTSNAGAQANQITGANVSIARIDANLGSFQTYANATFGASYGNVQMLANLAAPGNVTIGGNIFITSNATAGTTTRVEANIPHPFMLMGA